jgi:hypothetical protein
MYPKYEYTSHGLIHVNMDALKAEILKITLNSQIICYGHYYIHVWYFATIAKKWTQDIYIYSYYSLKLVYDQLGDCSKSFLDMLLQLIWPSDKQNDKRIWNHVDRLICI